ncbi:MAG: zinc-ribbon domain-containing protein, partial [Pseudonocardiaceae bacterium]
MQRRTPSFSPDGSYGAGVTVARMDISGAPSGGGDRVIVCRNCGSHNADGDAFCGSCGEYLEWSGEKLEPAQAEQTAAEPEPQPAPERPLPERPAPERPAPEQQAAAALVAPAPPEAHPKPQDRPAPAGPTPPGPVERQPEALPPQQPRR